MRCLPRVVAVMLVLGVSLPLPKLPAQQPAAVADTEEALRVPAQEQPFWDNAQAFVDAYAARDAQAIGQLFTEDAEFLDEFGDETVGRDAIVALFQAVFDSSPDASIEAIDLERVRFITPQVALEEGITRSRPEPGGVLQPSRYVALHVKGDDNVWRVNTLKSFGQQAEERAEHLGQLAWLVGEWVNEGGDTVVHTTCRWSDDGNFLLRQFEISREGETVMQGVQRIGWDPVQKQLRSWTFDSGGGFFAGRWIHAGDHWIVTVEGVTAEGEPASGTASYTLIDAEMITWYHRDLIIGNDVQEEMEPVVMVRRPPQPVTGQ